MRLLFTKVYKGIRNPSSAQEIYKRKLLESGIDQLNSKVLRILNEEFMASKDYVPQRRDWRSAYWAGFKSPEQQSRIRNTGVKPEILKNVGKAITTLSETFKPWQDVERGTFSHRRSLIQSVDMMYGQGLMSRRVVTRGFAIFIQKEKEDTSAPRDKDISAPSRIWPAYSQPVCLFPVSLGSVRVSSRIGSRMIRFRLPFGKGDTIVVNNEVGLGKFEGLVIDKTLYYVVIKEQSESDDIRRYRTYIPYVYFTNKDITITTKPKPPALEKPKRKKWYYLWLK